ncbi:MAG: TolC family protein [Bacteroidetes bacterium]|nr:TolC family protein [Bacteroidota bacterium]
MLRRAFPAVLPLLLAFPSFAQDTLHVSIHKADSLLLARSLDLIAQRFEVDKAEADRVQARLFNNPSFQSEWSVRPSNGSFFDIGPGGEKVFSVEQLFRIAGQRSLAVRAAAQRKRLSEAEYAEMAAALRYRLHSDLYRQFFVTRALTAINSQLDLLKGVVDAYGDQYDKGNVSLKEVTRLRASYFDLNAQRVDLRQQLNALQQELRALLVEERTVLAAPAPAEVMPVRVLRQDSTALVGLAEQNRARLQAAQAAVDAGELDLKLQRRMAIPDLSLGATYDQNGNYLPDYTALTAGLSIPLFDRNQGRIKRANAELGQARAQLAGAQVSVRQEVLRALADLHVLQDQYTSTSQGFDEQLDQLSESLIGNYTKSNISLLEFTDLFESYNASIIAVNALKADLQNAYEELEFATGQRLFDR